MHSSAKTTHRTTAEPRHAIPSLSCLPLAASRKGRSVSWPFLARCLPDLLTEKPAWHAASAHPLPQHLPSGHLQGNRNAKTNSLISIPHAILPGAACTTDQTTSHVVVQPPRRNPKTIRTPLHVPVKSRQRLAVGSSWLPRRETAHSLRQRPSISRPSLPAWLCSGGTGTTLTSSNPASHTCLGLLHALCSWLHTGGKDGHPACWQARPPWRSSLACHCAGGHKPCTVWRPQVTGQLRHERPKQHPNRSTHTLTCYLTGSRSGPTLRLMIS